MSEPIGQLEQLTAAINKLADAYIKSTVQTASNGNSSVAETPATVVKTSQDDTGTVDADTTTKKTTGGRKTTATKKADEVAKSERTKQETLDAVVAVKDALGAPAARELLARHGFAKLSEVNDAKRYDALYEDATGLLAEQPADESNDEEI